MADGTSTIIDEALATRRRKREKPQLSCVPCRRRKVKCDRNHPCAKCLQRNQIAECIFVTFSPSQRTASSRLGASLLCRNPIRDYAAKQLLPLQGRYTFGDSSAAREHVGRMQIDPGETSYTGGEHWTTIAASLGGTQESITRQPLSALSLEDKAMPGLLQGLHSGVTEGDILACLPSKAETDILINIYFESVEASIFLTHQPTFQEQYSWFWKYPSSVSMNWLSMLFSIMSLATKYAAGLREEPQSNGISEGSHAVSLYRQRSAECLVLANYLQPTIHTVEALILNVLCELIRAPRNPFSIYITFSIAVRVSMRMGYHRDPSRFPQISIFDGEIRRRVWNVVVQLDVLLAFQLGQPTLINYEECDTQIPLNVLNVDLHPGITSLPLPRVHNPPDQLAYVLARANLTEVLGRIHRVVSSIHPTSYEAVKQLQKILNSKFNEVPHCLKLHRGRNIDPDYNVPSVMMRRVCIDLLYQQARCVLHRRFMTAENQLHHLSWDTCVDASLRIIEHQSFVWGESRSGGSFYGHDWKVIKLCTSHFLLAAMILCLALRALGRDIPTASNSEDRKSERLYLALEESYRIWKLWGSTTEEASRAMRLLEFLLDKAGKQETTNQFRSWEDSTVTIPPMAPTASKLISPNLHNCLHNCALQSTIMPTFPLATSADPSSNTPFEYGGVETSNHVHGWMENIMMSNENIDWVTWDTQLAQMQGL